MGSLLNKASKQKIRDMLENIREQIKAMEATPENKENDMEQITAYLNGMIRSLKNKQSSRANGWDFSVEKHTAVFAEDDQIILRPFKDQDNGFYCMLGSPDLPHTEQNDIRQEVLDSIWASAVKKQAFYCIVEDKELGPVGFIGLKDTSCNLWEVALEFESQYCHKGYGAKALPLFLKQIKEVTGKNQFQALVEVDNIASQGLMKKLGGKLIDIYDFIFKDEEQAEEYEAAHLDLITNHMRELATQLGIEPQKLLSHVLDYRLFI